MANENLDLKNLRALLTTTNASWQGGETSFSRLSDEDQRKRLGYKPGPGESSLRERENMAVANLAGNIVAAM